MQLSLLIIASACWQPGAETRDRSCAVSSHLRMVPWGGVPWQQHGEGTQQDVGLACGGTVFPGKTHEGRDGLRWAGVKGQVLRSATRWAVWPTDRQPTRITYSATGWRARLSPVASADQIVAVGYYSLSWTSCPLCWQQKGWVFMGCPPLWGGRNCCSCLTFRGFNGDSPTACQANEAKCHWGETILIPFTGGAEGREEVGYSKCHTGLELECPFKWDSICWALPLETGANVEGKLLRALGSPAQGTHGTAGSVEGLEVGLGSLVWDGTLRGRIDQEGVQWSPVWNRSSTFSLYASLGISPSFSCWYGSWPV